jgi:hypothetical protein
MFQVEIMRREEGGREKMKLALVVVQGELRDKKNRGKFSGYRGRK